SCDNTLEHHGRKHAVPRSSEIAARESRDHESAISRCRFFIRTKRADIASEWRSSREGPRRASEVDNRALSDSNWPGWNCDRDYRGERELTVDPITAVNLGLGVLDA